MVYDNQLHSKETRLQHYKNTLRFLNDAGAIRPINGSDSVLTYLPDMEPVVVTNRCLKRVDDIYCHWHFQQYRMPSTRQSVCREECERVYFHICKDEFQFAEEYNKKDNKAFSWFWEIIDCTLFPWQNTSHTEKVEPSCYHYDHVRGERNKTKQTPTHTRKHTGR